MVRHFKIFNKKFAYESAIQATVSNVASASASFFLEEKVLRRAQRSVPGRIGQLPGNQTTSKRSLSPTAIKGIHPNKLERLLTSIQKKKRLLKLRLLDSISQFLVKKRW